MDTYWEEIQIKNYFKQALSSLEGNYNLSHPCFLLYKEVESKDDILHVGIPTNIFGEQNHMMTNTAIIKWRRSSRLREDPLYHL